MDYAKEFKKIYESPSGKEVFNVLSNIEKGRKIGKKDLTLALILEKHKMAKWIDKGDWKLTDKGKLLLDVWKDQLKEADKKLKKVI